MTFEPDVKVLDVAENHQILIVACDGLWDVVSNEEAVAIARYVVYIALSHSHTLGSFVATISKVVHALIVNCIVAFLTEPRRRLFAPPTC